MQISEKVRRVLQAEQISAEELYQMLDAVAFTSIRGCNRRYFQWLFVVKDNVLQDMQRLDLIEIGQGTNRMVEEHEACAGDGCRACGWVGQVSRAIEDPTIQRMRGGSGRRRA